MNENDNGQAAENGILGRLSAQGNAASLPGLITFVVEKVKEQGFNEKRVDEISCALTEALGNIVSHAFAAKDGEIEIVCGLDNAERLVISIVDDGAPFNMMLADDPFINPGGDAEKNVSTRTLKKLMDTVEYKRLEKKNHLTLTASAHLRSR